MMFLERNINVVMSNASCMPLTSYNENVPFNNLKRMKEKTNKRLVDFFNDKEYFMQYPNAQKISRSLDTLLDIRAIFKLVILKGRIYIRILFVYCS